MSGGKPLVVEGRTLDPRVQFLAAMGKRQPAMDTLAPDAARKAAGEGLALLDGSPSHDVDIAQVDLPVPGRPPIRAR